MTQSAMPTNVLGRKQEQVIHAARDLFLQHGFEGATMNMIAAQAEVSKATLYAYYPTKEQVFVAVIQREVTTLRATIMSTSEDESRPIRDKLLEIGNTVICAATMPDHVFFFRAIIAATLRFPELGRIINQDFRAPLRDSVAQMLLQASQKGELSCPDPQFAAQTFLSIVRGDVAMTALFDASAARELQAGVHEHVRESVEVFLRAFGGGCR
ncbi:TetR family transcriptional regulator [Bordetella tumbae]|uniref:TetR/AcrR family transcriptional regulator n=1 Tax=Bordetella tumbae TaxID=1649139 RepID=UPI0039EF7C10